jgi:hypothetical protein
MTATPALAPPQWVLDLDLVNEHLLIRERDADRWWQIHPDGTRTLVGDQGAAEARVRAWHAWTAGHEVPGVGWVDGEYVGDRYHIVRCEAAVLEYWPDASPVKEFR